MFCGTFSSFLFRSYTAAMLIVDEFTEVETSTGKMRIRVMRPKDESRRWPGIVLWSEIFQITGPIARSAQIFACNGFVVAVPEIYHEFLPPGVALSYTPEDTAKGNEYKAAKEISAFDSDIDASVKMVLSHPSCNGAVGTVGFCIGGALAFRTATHPDVKAAVCWYATDVHKGSLGKSGDDTLSLVGKIKGEMCMIYGRQDPHVPAEGRDKVRAALHDAGVNFTWLEVNGQHAFMRDEGSYGRYDGELALQTYDWALKMLHKRLG
jgi:carboxymethylenebutenolidase